MRRFTSKCPLEKIVFVKKCYLAKYHHEDFGADLLTCNQLLPGQMESQSSPLHVWNETWKLLSTDWVTQTNSWIKWTWYNSSVSQWPFQLTVLQQWKTFETRTSVTGRSRCQSGTGRTPGAGHGPPGWDVGPDLNPGMPAGLKDCSIMRGHSPLQSLEKRTRSIQLNRKEILQLKKKSCI